MSKSSSAPEDGSNFVTIAIKPDPGFTLVFDGMTVTEELGRPFLIELNLSSGKARSTIESTLGSSVTITMTDAGGKKTYFNGILARASFAGMSGGVYRYHVELRPWIWLLSRTSDCKIFQKKSVWDIINAVFRDKGFDALEDKRQNQSGEIVADYCVQYRESALDFVTRLMEQHGLYYYFEHKDGEHKLILCDDPNSHTSIGAAIPFQYGQTEQRSVDDHVWEWTADLHLQPGAYSYLDYNFTTPSADMTTKSRQPGSHPHGALEVFDYPGGYDNPTDGQKLADVRMQAFKSQQRNFDGRSNARGIRAGYKFTLKGAADESLNKEYLITRAVSTISMAEGASDSRGQLVDSHRVTFSAVPGDLHYRLDQRTAKPVVRGPQTAKVVGESGEEITTDQYGRVKVQFYWDRVGSNDENSSCWIRVAQSMGGAGWGAMFIPRVGMEVVVAFLEGNPDRPLVTGVVYNATQTVPYPLPDKKVVTTFKTSSSKGGGGSNELRFDDTKGKEEFFLQAQYDYNKTVLNNATATITKDSTTTVKEGNHALTVSQGNHTTTVSQGNRSATVSQGNDGLTVSAGDLSITISAGSASMTAGQSITLSVAGSSIKIDAQGITLSAPQISGKASATMSLDGGTSMTLKAAMIAIN